MSLRNTIFEHVYGPLGFPGSTSGKEPACQCRRHKRQGFGSGVRKITWKRKWRPTPAFLPGEFQGQRSPGGYSPWVPLSMGVTKSWTQLKKLSMHARGPLLMLHYAYVEYLG